MLTFALSILIVVAIGYIIKLRRERTALLEAFGPLVLSSLQAEKGDVGLIIHGFLGNLEYLDRKSYDAVMRILRESGASEKQMTTALEGQIDYIKKAKTRAELSSNN